METLGGPGSPHQSCGTDRRSHWPPHAGLPAAGDPPCQAVDFSSGGWSAHADSLQPDRWHRRTGSHGRDTRPQGKATHAPGRPSSAGSSPRPARTQRAGPCATNPPPPTWVPLRRRKSAAGVSIPIYTEAWHRGWDGAEFKVGRRCGVDRCPDPIISCNFGGSKRIHLDLPCMSACP